jgi:cell division septation protein DedD
MYASTTHSTATDLQLCREIPTDNAALAEAITRLAGHINAAQHRFLKLLAVLIERGAWSDGGSIKSPAHWLNYYCGIDLGAAREKVRVARCLVNLPEINTAFASGAISYSKVRAMTRSATPQNESFLLGIASHGAAHHMEMLVRKYQRTARQIGSSRVQGDDGANPDDQAQHQSRELSWHYDDDGMLVIRGRLAPEDGALFINALNSVFQQLSLAGTQFQSQAQSPSQAQPPSQPPAQTQTQTPTQSKKESQMQQEIANKENVSAETSLLEPEITFPQKRADALMLMVEHALQTMHDGLAPMAAADRHQVVIHIECDKRDKWGWDKWSQRHYIPSDSTASVPPPNKVTPSPSLKIVTKAYESNASDPFHLLSLTSIEAGPFLSPGTAR